MIFITLMIAIIQNLKYIIKVFRQSNNFQDPTNFDPHFRLGKIVKFAISNLVKTYPISKNFDLCESCGQGIDIWGGCNHLSNKNPAIFVNFVGV